MPMAIGLAASLRGDAVVGPETDPRCLVESCLQMSALFCKEIFCGPDETHFWSVKHSDVEIPKTQSTVLADTAEPVRTLVAPPKIKR